MTIHLLLGDKKSDHLSVWNFFVQVCFFNKKAVIEQRYREVVLAR